VLEALLDREPGPVLAAVHAAIAAGQEPRTLGEALISRVRDAFLASVKAPLDHLPELVIGDMEAAKVLTTRHLLTHTAGFEGDIFTDTGRGDDALAKYVESLAELPQLFAPGLTFSYNNTGFVVLGRLVEVLRGKPFDEVLVERIAQPLGLASVSPSPYEAILHRAATGHVADDDGAMTPAPMWALARSNAPAGSMLAMTASDLLGFVRMHLQAGTGPDAASVLSAESVEAMQTRQVDLPVLSGMGDGWGLGWELFDTDQGVVVAHDGGTIGQAAFLRAVPEQGVAIALLTNGGDFFGLFNDVVARLLRELTGVVLPARPTPPAEPQHVDPTDYLSSDPLTYGDDQPVRARVLVDAARASLVTGALGDDAVVERRDDGGVVVALDVVNRDAFRAFVLDLLDHAEVLDPPELRAEVVDWLTVLAASDGGR